MARNFSPPAYTGNAGKILVVNSSANNVEWTATPSVTSQIITGSTASTSPTTGALVVTGGMGIGGTVNIGTGLVLGVDAATNTAGTYKMWSAGSNDYYTTFTAGTQTANATYTLPTSMPTQDGSRLSSTTAGVLSWVIKTYGSMSLYDNSTNTVINKANTYHGIENLITGTCLNFTFKAGTKGTITAFETYLDGAATLVTCGSAHGLLSGEPVTIQGATAATRDNSYIITKVDDTKFSIPLAWSGATDTGFFQRGSTLKAGTGASGVYKLDWTCTGDAIANTTEFKIEANQNATDLDSIAAESYYNIGTDTKCMGANGFITISDGDYIWLSIKNETDDTDFLLIHTSVTINRV